MTALVAANSSLEACDVRCAKEECLRTKKDFPFEVNLACTREMCQCRFNLSDSVYVQRALQEFYVQQAPTGNQTEVAVIRNSTDGDNSTEGNSTINISAPENKTLDTHYTPDSSLGNLSVILASQPMSDSEFFKMLESLPAQKREKVDELRQDMDKLKYKWDKYASHAKA